MVFIIKILRKTNIKKDLKIYGNFIVFQCAANSMLSHENRF